MWIDVIAWIFLTVFACVIAGSIVEALAAIYGDDGETDGTKCRTTDYDASGVSGECGSDPEQ